MPATGAAWRCPSCKRLVPGGVDACRCGGTRPAFIYTPPDETATAESPWRSLSTVMVVVLACLGLYFWYQSYRDRAGNDRDGVTTAAGAAPARPAPGPSASQPGPAAAIPAPDPTPTAPGPDPLAAVVANADGAPVSL